LGPHYVRVVEVEQSGGETRVARRGSAPLPVNCWNDVPANREAMAASIKEALAAGGIVTRTVVACLPRRLVTVRFARVPHAPPEHMRGMVEFEAQQYILFPLDEVILDYHAPSGIGAGLTAGQDDMQTVLLAAARRSLIFDVVSLFDRVGVELRQLSVSALALAEHVRDSLEPTAVIALESGAMDVSVVADGQLLFTRSSALEIAGIAPDVAARRFSEEVARSFTAYQNEFRQKPLAHIYLCGSETATAAGDWMDQALMEALEKPVARLHNRLVPAADPEAPSYAIATGMALEALGGALSDINLVPNERAEKKLQAQRASRQRLIAVAAVACVVAGAFFVQAAMAQQERRRVATVAANKAMEAAQKDEKPIQQRHDRVTALDRILTQSLDRDHPSVDVLVAINRCLPASTDIWLTQLNFDRVGLMTLRGDSKNARAVTDLLINLQASGAFTDVRLSYIADAQDSASPSDTVQAAPKPPVTPLPGLQPTAAAPVPGAAPVGGTPLGAAVAAVPGGAPGAPAGGTVTPGAGGFNPGAGGPGPGGFRRRNFFAGGGGAAGGAPAGYNPGGYNPNGGAPTQFVQNGAPNRPVTAAAPGQPPAAQFNPGAPQPGGAPGAAGAATAPGGRVIITPDMAANGGRPPFSPEAMAAWRQFRDRNRVTGGGMPSSVPTGAVPGAAGPSTPPVAPATVAAAPAPKPVRRPTVAPKAAKPTLTGFVITCRLRPNAKLVPPDAKDMARNSTAPERAKTAAAVPAIHGETDNSDDTGDLE
jgi:Tfp pilus assembly PilM family ATPase/Tfp pilus assembly protein PilN